MGWRDTLGIREDEALDEEGRRRLLNQHRRNIRRRETRRAWLGRLEALESPEVVAELLWARKANPAIFRKMIRKLAKKHGFYAFHQRFVDRGKPPADLAGDGAEE